MENIILEEFEFESDIVSTTSSSESEESIIITEEEYEEVEENIQLQIDELLSTPEEYLQFSKPDFKKNIISEVIHTIFDGLILSDTCSEFDETVLDSIQELAENTLELYMDIHELPKRSEALSTPSPLSQTDIIKITEQINILRKIPQPIQRTPEWYEFRHNLITASNIYKIFGSDANVNSLIYEKCKPYIVEERANNYVNTSLPTHWGTKYETLSVMLYEYRFNTKIEEFGCIPHQKIHFIGASPDGINCDPSSLLYGRMLEIKNIVNREIDGIPSEAYWTQMQIQMETCDLNECDFLETRFKEYLSEEEFWLDTSRNEGNKGLVLYFTRKDCIPDSPLYKFLPLNVGLDKSNISEWIETTKAELEEEFVLYEIQYWYLDEFSCVLVRRNRKWFTSALSKMQDIWKTIEKERVEGYEHRAPKKKQSKIMDQNAISENAVESDVLMNLDTNSKIVTIVPNSPISLVKLS
jgi:putative phage-type endonuclease